MVPALLVALDLAGEPPPRWLTIVRSRLALYAGFALAVYFALRALVLDAVMPTSQERYSLSDKLFLVPLTIGAYLHLLFLPVEHRVFYAIERVRFGFTGEFWAALGAIAVFGALLWTGRRNAPARIGAAMLAVALLPQANIVSVPTNFYVAAARLYFPAVGFAIFATALLLRHVERWTASRVWVDMALLAALAVYALSIEARVGIWRDQLTFVQSLVRVDPTWASLRHDLGVALKERGRAEEARVELEEAVRLRPGFGKAWLALGDAYAKLGLHEKALDATRKATTLPDGGFDGYMRLGALQDSLKQYAEALKSFSKAIELRPSSGDAYFNFGRSARGAGRFEESLAAFQRATSLNPRDDEAWNSMGLTLREMGRVDEELAAFGKAIEIRNQNYGAHQNYGVTLARQGRRAEAERVLALLRERDPKRAQLLEGVLGRP